VAGIHFDVLAGLESEFLEMGSEGFTLHLQDVTAGCAFYIDRRDPDLSSIDANHRAHRL
jgi:hypothetical protein